MEDKQNETVLVDGLFFDRPREGAPDFVKGRISIQADKLTEFVAKHKNEKGYVNIDLLKSKAGKLYCKLNTFVPEAKPEMTKDDIPF
jgi:hypothetical protein